MITSIDGIKIIAPLILTILGLSFAIYQYWHSKPRYRFRIFQHIEPNVDGVGTYLCARIHISNSGGKTGVFQGFTAIEQDGNEYYPMSTLVAGEEIGPEKMISGVIPIGHLLEFPPKTLYMQDGLLNRKKIPRKMLRRTIQDLKNQKSIYEQSGWSIHPTKGIRDIEKYKLADVHAYLYNRADNVYGVALINSGQTPAYQVEFSLKTADDQVDILIASEYESKFPIDVMMPGQFGQIYLTTSIPLNMEPIFDSVIKWKGADGENFMHKRKMSLR